jgi:hypothetical protein
MKFKPKEYQTWLDLLVSICKPLGLEHNATSYFVSLRSQGFTVKEAAHLTAWNFGLLLTDDSGLSYMQRDGYAVVDHVSLPALPPSEVGEA